MRGFSSISARMAPATISPGIPSGSQGRNMGDVVGERAVDRLRPEFPFIDRARRRLAALELGRLGYDVADHSLQVLDILAGVRVAASGIVNQPSQLAFEAGDYRKAPRQILDHLVGK